MFLGGQDRRSGSTKWAAHSASPSHQPKTHQCWANATARQSGLTQCIGKTLCELPSLEPVIACSHWCFGAGDDRLRRKAAVAFVGEVGAKRATKTSPEMLNLTHQFCGRALFKTRSRPINDESINDESINLLGTWDIQFAQPAKGQSTTKQWLKSPTQRCVWLMFQFQKASPQYFVHLPIRSSLLVDREVDN